MQTSPLQLDAYFSVKTAVTYNEGRAADAGLEDANLQVSVGRGRHNEDPRKWKVDLNVALQDTDERPSLYSIDISMRGFFTVAEEYPEDRIEMMVAANAPAVLYGGVREIVALLTSRGPAPGLILPSLTFIDEAKKLGAKPNTAEQVSKGE
jgi:preprotein translocase subunit SecB